MEVLYAVTGQKGTKTKTIGKERKAPEKSDRP